MIRGNVVQLGDVVMRSGDSHKMIEGEPYTVDMLDTLGDKQICRLRGKNIGPTGWWTYSDNVKIADINLKECRFCKSTCKREEPCVFFDSMFEREVE